MADKQELLNVEAALAKAERGWARDKVLGGTLAIKVGPGQHTLTAQRP